MPKAMKHTLLAEDGKGIEQRRCGGAPGHCQANGSEQLSGFEAEALRQGPQGALQDAGVESL